jgi:hypothetical protein
MLIYLPPYSPDLNPIEESFGMCKWYIFLLNWSNKISGKAYLRHHGLMICNAEDLVLVLLEACSCITAEMVTGWFCHAGYIIIEE